jgi:uncharacterized membrane protein
MIQPERFSDIHQAFKEFRKVTGVWHLLKFSRQHEFVSPRWPLVLLLVAYLPTIWIVHFFIPLSVVQVFAAPNDKWLWLYWVLLGIIALIVLFLISYLIASHWMLRRLKDAKLVDNEATSFVAEIERLMLHEFTDYLARKGFYNLEALSQLIENTRDEIEARWRPSPVLLTLITLAVALIISYFQAVFSQFLQNQFQKYPHEDIGKYFFYGLLLSSLVLGVGFILNPILLSYVLPIGPRYLSLRSERAIYMHCLSNIRLSLLKSSKEESIKPEKAIASPPAQIPKPATFLLYCEFRHPFRKKQIHFSLPC